MAVEADAHGQRNPQDARRRVGIEKQLLALGHRLAVDGHRVDRVVFDVSAVALAGEDQIDREVDEPDAAGHGLRKQVRRALDVDSPGQIGIQLARLQAQLPAQSSTEANW